jgi:rhodanese-related sulfurtransferase
MLNKLKFGIIITLVIGIFAALLAGCSSKPAGSTQILEDVTAQKAMELIENNANNPDFIILDIRTPDEFASGHIEKAINIDFYEPTFKDDINKLDKTKTYLLYCRTGNRSSSALQTINTQGFEEIYHLFRGITEWTNSGYPTVR